MTPAFWLICRTVQHAQLDSHHHIYPVKGQCKQVSSTDTTKSRTQDITCFRTGTHRHSTLSSTLLLKTRLGSSINTKNHQNPLAVCERNSEFVTGGHFIIDSSTGVSKMRSRSGDTLSYHNIGSGHQAATRPKAKLVSRYHTENLIKKNNTGLQTTCNRFHLTIYHLSENIN